MQIVVNEKSLSCCQGTTVHDLLVKLGLLPNAILVERNGAVVRRSQYSTTVLAEGDSFVLIKFVGGG